MRPASRVLIHKAQEYEQRAAHHAERAEVVAPEQLDEELGSATGFTLAAMILREVADALEHEAEELAA